MIEFLTRPEIQGTVLNELGFFPVVAGVDTSNMPEGISIEGDEVSKTVLLPLPPGETGAERLEAAGLILR